VGFDIWEMLNDKAAVLEALERMEGCTAYANKLIALHGEGEAKEAAERYFEHSDLINGHANAKQTFKKQENGQDDSETRTEDAQQIQRSAQSTPRVRLRFDSR